MTDDLHSRAEAMEQRADREKKLRFERWLDEPMVRVGLSMIPAGAQADTLKMLLQSAFDAGHSCGVGTTVASVVETIVNKSKRPGG